MALQLLPQEVANHITIKISPSIIIGGRYLPILMIKTTGKFTVMLVWYFIRQREEKE